MHAAPSNSQPPQDQDAEFLALLAQCEPQLAACVHAMVPVWQDADDILQRTRVALWRSFGNYRPGSNFLAWARTVARYEVRAYRKRDRVRPRRFSEGVEELLLAQLAQTPTVENRRWTAFLECSQELGGEARDILQDVYVERRRIKDVAEQRGRTAGGTYMALSRIRRRLMECIDDRLQEDDS